MYIKNLRINWNQQECKEYYNEILSINNLETLDFKKRITFFVGENGSGKSTLLEAIAVKYGFNPEGGSINYNFSTKPTHSSLSELLTLSKGIRSKDGFFLRAESFYNMASYVDDIGIDFEGYGGRSLHEQSHGESFLTLINNRFRGNGLYLLDEPEAALSPQRQLSLLVMINKLVNNNSQFIIATHSPILLGIDDAAIYSFDNDDINQIPYEETESYNITKLFIENREILLKRLMNDSE
ncbi:AAA family ATPase [Anaerosacchariphilus polymeriproducens]|uniref:ATP-binding cassette domain-containing protein n=1 Tax=Anaerosacchariphilus polymeriproducens TaxID=1812858 RepID=A0A371AUJ8_9FIRM|nr:AAA family ATPase [Anaerosacchariphilus polymeriproducens]RDU23245.1 ATP-binding cassette domain-containing protein [Anaerosacchariphilus polymeriproducens]